jgi:pimeloyl-ACP methyl ester carboxylesterase
MTSAKHPQSSYPACFPQVAAARIKDPTAIAMMRDAVCTPVKTTLLDSAIETVHVRGGAGVPGVDAAVILLHGFDSNCLEYRRLRAAFADAPLVCYFVDILGWGFTAKPPGISYGVEAKRAHLLAWRNIVIEDERVIVAGASIGGAVALDYSLAHPKDVAGIVLIDAQAYTDKAEAPLLRAIPALAQLGAAVLRSRWLRMLAVNLSYESEALRCDDTLNIGGLHCKTDGWLDASVDFIQGEGYCLSERVSQATCPALVLYGVQDKILPSAENSLRFQNDLRQYGCKVVAIDNCGHSPHIEHPALVAGHILDFVSTLDSIVTPTNSNASVATG